MGYLWVPFLVGKCLKNRKSSFYLMQGLRFFILLIYFAFVGFYLKWFMDPASAISSILIFVAIYLIIWISIYLWEKRLVEKMNQQLK